MTTIHPFTIDNTGILYYNNKDLKLLNPYFFYGFQSDPKHIIQRKNIPDTDYVFACHAKTKGWSIYDNKCKRAQLLIKKTWVDKFYFNTPPVTPKKHVTKPDVVEESEQHIGEDDIVEQAPSILELNNDEKFRDTDGNIVEIETRGEQNRNNIYFKVKDVSVGFEMPNLDQTLINKDRGYERDIDYKILFIRVVKTNDLGTTIKKCLYLTYHGLLRVLFVSRNKQVKRFQDWAEEKLFTCQMGSKDEKEELVADVMNMDVKNVRAMFSKYASTFPCIYLLSLGLVKDLRDIFNIDSNINGDTMVYKFGRTEDFDKRLADHQRTYGKMKNVNISIVCFHIIDVKYLSEAETSINHFCTNFSKRLLIDKYKELVVFNNTELKEVKNQYKMLGDLYMGATAGLQKQIQDLTHKLELCEKELENMKERHERQIEFTKLQCKYELLLKQNELDEYKRVHP
jgi:AraC-like DNA-binding protein